MKQAISFKTEGFGNITEYLVTTRNQIKSAQMRSTRTLLLDTVLLGDITGAFNGGCAPSDLVKIGHAKNQSDSRILL